MRLVFASILFSIALATEASAQTFAESSSGESSLLLNDGGMASMNFADASVKIAYGRRVSTSPWRASFEVKAKGTEGYTSLFKSGQFTPQYSGSAFLGYFIEPLKPNSTDHTGDSFLIGVRVEQTRAKYFLAEGAAGAMKTTNTIFHGTSAAAHLNSYFHDRGIGSILAGASIGYGESNNYPDLEKVQVCRQVSSGGNNVANKCDEGRFGGFATKSAASADFNVLWTQRWLENRVVLGPSANYNAAKQSGRWNLGIGLFLTKDGSPLKILGGITAEHSAGAWRIGLQTGLPF
jgi:hypothetical protein